MNRLLANAPSCPKRSDDAQSHARSARVQRQATATLGVQTLATRTIPSHGFADELGTTERSSSRVAKAR